MYLSKVKADSSTEQDAAIGQRRRGPAYLILPLVGLAVIYLAFRWWTGAGAPPAPPPATVTIARPLSRMVMDWDDYVGRFEASKAVEVRPRVSGQLVGLHFKDGDIVKQGQLLFTIDPRPFTAQLDQAKAQVAEASTSLALAKADLARASRLIADQAVSAEEIDSLRAKAQSAQAQLASAQAAVRARQLDVEFAQVRAPITGRVSDRRVDVGNLVAGDSASAATVLTTINALDPIYFSFNGSEALYLKHQRQQEAANTAEVRLQDEADYKWKGKVDFTDNAIDNGSGTIRGRAVIANPNYFLVPGMFGNMRLGGAQAHRALLVPDGAVVTDQTRKVVYVVAKDGTTSVKPVEIGALANGLRVIRSGLDPADQVVIQGTQYVMPGVPVKTVAGRIDIAKAVASQPVAAPLSSQATLAD
ncbi:MAG TPA: efflux RND transporter periplasmic adaptor subunit [Sphingobium sp.]|uniref:efflux RND transporter periplasmic adaptor subunit n=1 Tax=Sphingobium sp. TaxID=1912891 RepID=UPI002ED063B9